MANTGTPRPLPKFFLEGQTFSTKKARGGTPRDCAPPRPPMKSAPPISRIHQHRPVTHAQLVSFKTNHNNNNSLQSYQLYDEKSKDLYFDQCFTIEARIGCGSFGEVFKVRSKESGNYYAVKRSRERFRGETDRRRKLEEVAKHEQLPKHPNCVRYYQAWEERQHLYIQTELCQMSLSNFSDTHHDIPEKIIWNYLVDLLMAVKHLHDHDLVHMDIKPDNIFISGDGTCKLGDFGLVLTVSELSDNAEESQEGDPRYMAPELLQGRFTKIADIFSLGMTILELACDLELPKGGEGWHQLRSKQLPHEFVKNLSDELREVICLMIEPDPLLRPDADALLQLSFVNKVWRKRRYYQMYRAVVGCVFAVARFLVGVWLSIWLFLTKPLHRLIPDRLCSTPTKLQTNLTNTWEHSFSDDEFGDEDSINLSNNSMGVPLDTSTSSELDLSHDSNGFKVPNIPARKALTTPSRRRRPPGPKNSSPIMNLLSSFNRSPDRKNTSFHSDSSPTHSPENSFTEDIDDLKSPRTPIGPKNLIKVFDAADEL